MIELSRLEGRGAGLPSLRAADYEVAVREAAFLAENALSQSWDRDVRLALEGSLKALRGDILGARTVLDMEK